MAAAATRRPSLQCPPLWAHNDGVGLPVMPPFGYTMTKTASRARLGRFMMAKCRDQR